MKAFKIFSLILLVILIVLFSIAIFLNVSKVSDNDLKEKTYSEIKYLESKLINMLNSLNNIQYENYKISVENTSDSNKKYNMDKTIILNNDNEINWIYLQEEAELLQSLISSLTLDLFETVSNTSFVLDLNSDYDNLLLQIKNEEKESTLEALCKVYEDIFQVLKDIDYNKEYTIIIDTKLNVLKAYSLLDTKDWGLINKYIKTATTTFSELLTNIEFQNNNQYTKNKCYILLNNLQNCTEKEDKEIFLIKYKNLLEDLNNI